MVGIRRAGLRMRRPRRLATSVAQVAQVAVALGAAALLAAACGSSPAPSNPVAFLKSARSTLDAASAVHFVLTYQGSTPSGLALTGGNGDFARPDEFRGTLDVSDGGLPLQVQAVSIGDDLYLELPFQSSYSLTNPAKYGIGNPSHLIDPNSGISRLLTSAISPRYTGSERYRGELLTEVAATLPGSLVASLLVSKDPSQPVDALFAIDPSTDQVRLATLTGPFYFADKDTTFHLVLESYGEHITIRAP